VVVGGGRVAERKVGPLLEAGAEVLVVAPRATASIRRRAAAGLIRWRRGAYRPADLRGARFVLAATADPSVNRDVARAAGRARAFVAAVDDPALCTLFMPAILRRGDLIVAVSTGGRSPGLARLLRDDLARGLAPGFNTTLRSVGAIRDSLRRGLRDSRARARAIKSLLEARGAHPSRPGAPGASGGRRRPAPGRR
jgi:precorrin-2 dehydrogenase/sirohydrochlorin ferrochelatase